MNFAEHTKRNWLITLFAALFLGSVVTMLFLNEPRNTVVILMSFIAASLIAFGVVLTVWYAIHKRRQAQGKRSLTTDV